MTKLALEWWAAYDPTTDELEARIPAPPVDPIYAVLTRPERFRATVLTLLRDDRDRRPPKTRRPIDRQPRQTKKVPRTPDALIRWWTTATSTKPVDLRSVEDREAMWQGLEPRVHESTRRWCPIDGDELHRGKGSWRHRHDGKDSHASKTPKATLEAAAKIGLLGSGWRRLPCHVLYDRARMHLRGFRFLDRTIKASAKQRRPGMFYDCAECVRCGCRAFAERAWFNKPCTECGMFMPCKHPPGAADFHGTRGSDEKAHRGLACVECDGLIACPLCLHALAVGRGCRLACPQCDAAFASNSAESKIRCPACGSSETRPYHSPLGRFERRSTPLGEIVRSPASGGLAGERYCEECGEDTYFDATVSRGNPNQEPPSRLNVEEDDRLEVAPVWTALQIMAEDPRERCDTAALVMYATLGKTDAEIAEHAAKRGWPTYGSRRWTDEGVATAVVRARRRFRELVEVLPDGKGLALTNAARKRLGWALVRP